MKIKYTDELIDRCTPIFKQGIRYIYSLSKQKTDLKKHVLRNFQERLQDIPKWNSMIIMKEFDRFKMNANCQWLDKLVKASFVAEFKHSKKIHDSKIKLEIPKSPDFIHICYIEIARALWSKPQLLFDGYQNDVRKINEEEIDLIVREKITKVIKDMLPLEQMISSFLKVEEDIYNSDNDEKSSIHGGGTSYHVGSQSPSESGSESDSESDSDSDSESKKKGSELPSRVGESARGEIEKQHNAVESMIKTISSENDLDEGDAHEGDGAIVRESIPCTVIREECIENAGDVAVSDSDVELDLHFESNQKEIMMVSKLGEIAIEHSEDDIDEDEDEAATGSVEESFSDEIIPEEFDEYTRDKDSSDSNEKNVVDESTAKISQGTVHYIADNSQLNTTHASDDTNDNETTNTTKAGIMTNDSQASEDIEKYKEADPPSIDIMTNDSQASEDIEKYKEADPPSIDIMTNDSHRVTENGLPDFDTVQKMNVATLHEETPKTRTDVKIIDMDFSKKRGSDEKKIKHILGTDVRAKDIHINQQQLRRKLLKKDIGF